MFLRPVNEIVDRLIKRAQELGNGCNKVFTATSGGVDSTVVVAVLCQAYDPENVVALFRNIKSSPKHAKDVEILQKTLGFGLIHLHLDNEYESIVAQLKTQFLSAGLEWHDENTSSAEQNGWINAYASLKSRFTTPLAGFISKAIDKGAGRVFGTGNAEEDGLLRYFDKFGDGAVDNNILDGLTKMEVRQIALYFSEIHENGEIFEKIALKTPSADLWGKGDEHNDEYELTVWARKMGFDKAELSYGNLEKEGTIAWAMKEDCRYGVITGQRKTLTAEGLRHRGYDETQCQTILFIRKIESSTRHKVELPKGLPRSVLRQEGYVT